MRRLVAGGIRLVLEAIAVIFALWTIGACLGVIRIGYCMVAGGC